MPPTGEILGPEQSPVYEYNEALCRAAKAYRMSTMHVAYYGHRMRMCEGWTEFGLEPGPRGEEAYREQLGIPRSSYYRAVRIGQAFHQLTLEELEVLPIGNAEILLSVNPMIIGDYPWVHEARIMSGPDLAAIVSKRNKLIGDNREPLASMTFKVPLLARKSIEGMIETFQKRHELTSKSQAFEMLVADRHDQSNVLAAMSQAKRLIEGSVEQLRRRGRLKDTDADQWLVMAMEVLDEAHKEAVQGTKGRKSV